MPDKPSADVAVDEVLVRELLRTQASVLPGAATLPLVPVNAGWDNTVWRLGDDYAVRLPRRELAAALVLAEQHELPAIAARLAATGIRVPTPLVCGRAGSGYPWAWSVVPWIEGVAGLRVPRGIRSGWAEPLAHALVALHVPADRGYPRNPFRGVPLADRADAVESRLSDLRRAGALDDDAHATLVALWSAGMAAAPWSEAPLWIHGDLHPGNLVADGGSLTGIIDFGDVTAGDPAYDLSVVWLAFDEAGRDAFATATAGRYDTATWVRAHAWAAAVTLMLLHHSDDNPEYLALGRECLLELTSPASAPRAASPHPER